MDKRTEKTKSSILNAFITLRARKPLEKISVKELTDLARINKTTFYRYYADVYALSEAIEEELIQNCLDTLPDQDIFFQEEGIYRLTEAFVSQSELFNIVFSGSRMDVAIHKMHDCLMERIFRFHPEFRENLEKKVMLTALIYGIFESYLVYKEEDFHTVIHSLALLNQAAL